MSLDELLGSLEDQAKLTDEELLIKYAPIFKFESDYLAKIKVVKDNEDDSEGDVEEATRRILEAKKKKKTSKKELQEQALKKLLLDDVDLLK